MSCTACDAILKLSRNHTCDGGRGLEPMGRRLTLAMSALPQIIAGQPQHLLYAGELHAKALQAICRESFVVADAMLKAEGREGDVSNKARMDLLEEVCLDVYKAMEAVVAELERAVDATRKGGGLWVSYDTTERLGNARAALMRAKDQGVIR